MRAPEALSGGGRGRGSTPGEERREPQETVGKRRKLQETAGSNLQFPAASCAVALVALHLWPWPRTVGEPQGGLDASGG
eukprot:9597480-Alexandrium_andersonii.AAC.1